MNDYGEYIKGAAERARGAPVRFVEHVPIVETFRGQVIWEGVVSEFDSDNGKVWAWGVEGDKEPQFIAVLHRPPIDSPLAAVRAWIVSTQRK